MRVYKCVDENGRVIFSQSPCGAASETIELRELLSPSATPESTQETARQRLDKLMKEQEERRAQRSEEEHRKRAEREARKQEAAARRERCEVARQNLRTLLMQRAVYRFDERGERVYLDDAERSAEIRRTADEIRQFCK